MYDDISRENIKLYKEYLEKFSVASINRKLSSLKSFNEYLLMLGLVEMVYIIKQDFIKKQQQGNPIKVTNEEVSAFLNNLKNDVKIMYKSRNIAIIYLDFYAGIRREEITNLKLKNLDLENKILYVLGKGNKKRKVPLGDIVIDALINYLESRKGYRFADSPYIFVSERSGKLHKCSINGIFNKYKIEECSNITPHQGRHTYSTNIVEQGLLTLPELQNHLGHSSLNIVSLYAHARTENIQKKINNLKIGL